MNENSNLIKLDVFSLNWLGQDPENARSAGMMSITYDEPINQEAMKTVILEVFTEYKFFCCNLVKKDGDYYFSIPDKLTREQIEQRLYFQTTSQEELFQELSMKSLNLFDDVLYQLYFLDHGDSFDIVIWGSHLIGDGLTSATGLSLVLNNYYCEVNNVDSKIFPTMEYKQLLEYAYTMRYNRFGRILWWPRWLRPIPGYFAYRRTTKFDVPNQVFNDPVPYDEQLLREKITFDPMFNDLLDMLKSELEINSNHLILALISYGLLDSQDYDRAICTYPINIRNQYGFEAGNLLTVNRIEVERGSDFISHLEEMSQLLEKEKNRSGPYYAISLGKFIKTDYEEVKKRMNKVVQESNLRFSNVGRLPAANLDMINEELFTQIPISNYFANALPLGNIGVHFFISSLENAYLNKYYLTILYSERTKDEVHEIIDHINVTIKSVFEEYNS